MRQFIFLALLVAFVLAQGKAPIQLRLDGANDVYKFDLQVTSGTGYTWVPELSENDIITVKKLAKDHKGQPGSKQTETFVVTAQKEGSVHLSMVLRRPWEKPLLGAKKVSYDIQVGAAKEEEADSEIPFQEPTKVYLGEANDVYKFELETTSGTGYTWVPRMDEEGVIEVKKVASERKGGLGGKQKDTYVITALKDAGKVHLTMVYRRPWAEKLLGEKQVTFVVQVGMHTQAEEESDVQALIRRVAPTAVNLGQSNDVYTFEVETTSGTGYTWVPKMSEEGVIKVEKVNTEHTGGNGGKQKDTYAITALKDSGRVFLSMVYRRPWEKPLLGMKQKTFDVKIGMHTQEQSDDVFDEIEKKFEAILDGAKSTKSSLLQKIKDALNKL